MNGPKFSKNNRSVAIKSQQVFIQHPFWKMEFSKPGIKRPLFFVFIILLMYTSFLPGYPYGWIGRSNHGMIMDLKEWAKVYYLCRKNLSILIRPGGSVLS